MQEHDGNWIIGLYAIRILYLQAVWERRIRSARSGWWVSHYTHDRGECILNSRPLTVETISDPTRSYNHFFLLTFWTWNQRSFLHEFWFLWKKEVFTVTSRRSKLTSRKRSFRINDIALLKQSNASRNQWSIEVNNDQKGLVWSVTLKTSKRARNVNSKRNFDKNALLLDSDNVNDFQ